MEIASGLRTNRTGKFSSEHRVVIGGFVVFFSKVSHSGFLLTSFRLFTDEEIQAIHNMTYHDVLVAVTSAEEADFQKSVFIWRDGTISRTCIPLLLISCFFQEIPQSIILHHSTNH